MISRVLVDDPEVERRVIHHFDSSTGRTHIETVQDVEDIVDAAKFEHGLHSDWRPYANGDWHKVATIPLNVLLDLKRRGIADDPKAMKRWLNDRENQVFRTMPGEV